MFDMEEDEVQIFPGLNRSSGFGRRRGGQSYSDLILDLNDVPSQRSISLGGQPSLRTVNMAMPTQRMVGSGQGLPILNWEF